MNKETKKRSTPAPINARERKNEGKNIAVSTTPFFKCEATRSALATLLEVSSVTLRDAERTLQERSSAGLPVPTEYHCPKIFPG